MKIRTELKKVGYSDTSKCISLKDSSNFENSNSGLWGLENNFYESINQNVKGENYGLKIKNSSKILKKIIAFKGSVNHAYIMKFINLVNNQNKLYVIEELLSYIPHKKEEVLFQHKTYKLSGENMILISLN